MNFYQKYRPEEYSIFQQNREWSNGCPFKRQKLHKWVLNYRTTGYHRQRGKRKIPGPIPGIENLAIMNNPENQISRFDEPRTQIYLPFEHEEEITKVRKLKNKTEKLLLKQ